MANTLAEAYQEIEELVGDVGTHSQDFANNLQLVVNEIRNLPQTTPTEQTQTKVILEALVADEALFMGSAENPLIPFNIAPPTITGENNVGKTLTANPGTWTHSPTSFAFRWFSFVPGNSVGFEIPGATEETYVLKSEDSTRQLRVRVVATNAEGDSASIESALTEVILLKEGEEPYLPQNISAPTVTGTAEVGKTLTAHEGVWGSTPTSFTHQWIRYKAGEAPKDTGKTGATYVVVAGDKGYKIRANEVAVNANGSSIAYHSPLTAEVP